MLRANDDELAAILGKPAHFNGRGNKVAPKECETSAPSTDKTAPAGDGSKPLRPLPFGDAWEFAAMFFPEVTPYRWQIEQLLQLSGYADPKAPGEKLQPSTDAPMLMTLVAANGSGKDQVVLAIWALYCVTCEVNFHWIGTSSSYVQLHEQTWKYIEAGARSINAVLPRKLVVQKHKIRCPDTKSEITLFRTDEGAKTEGWHPLVPGGQMAIILNECKSLEPEIVLAFKRCHGYTHWLNISSPGDPIGYFYEKCMTPKNVWPQPLILGESYLRRITVHDCPHLKAEFVRDTNPEDGFDLSHPYIQSSYLAQFVEAGKMRIIPQDRILYAYPTKTNELPRRAGLDLSGGGDATVLSVWQGNYFVGEWEWRERHEPTLTMLICGKIKELDIAPEQVVCDAGSMGTGIIQRMREEGLNVSGVHNQSAAKNKKVYLNRGAEMAMSFARLVTDKVLNLNGISQKLKRQMTERFYEVKDARIRLETKPDFRARCGYSPDNFDAAILAHANYPIHVFRAVDNADPDSKKPKDLGQNFKQEWESIYGKLDNDKARADLYRTSGVNGRHTNQSVVDTHRRLGVANRPAYRSKPGRVRA